jgi:hypothetical protein
MSRKKVFGLRTFPTEGPRPVDAAPATRRIATTRVFFVYLFVFVEE